jgi:hypothetical protein
MQQFCHLEGYVATNKCAGVVGCICYIFQFNRSLGK